MPQRDETDSYLVALGANLPSPFGAPVQTLAEALKRLSKMGLSLRAASRFFRSPAFPPGSGPDYVNACAEFRSNLEPDEVLSRMNAVERALGRERHARWEARGVDLDLIAANGAVLPDAMTQTAWRALPLDRQMREAPDRLILPHPRMQDRAFVLIPLAEIAPGWRHPILGLTVRQMLDALPEAEKQALTPISSAKREEGGLVNPGAQA